MSGLFHLGDTEPSPTPTDLVLTNEELLQAVNFAKTSIDRLKGYGIREPHTNAPAELSILSMNLDFYLRFPFRRQENAILNSPIHVSNSSSSYAQLLDSLPNNQTMEFDRMAQIVLKASQYLENNNCIK